MFLNIYQNLDTVPLLAEFLHLAFIHFKLFVIWPTRNPQQCTKFNCASYSKTNIRPHHWRIQGASPTHPPPLRVQILSFRHTKFLKCNCPGSQCPNSTRSTPRTGNPGFATAHPLNLAGALSSQVRHRLTSLMQNWYL